MSDGFDTQEYRGLRISTYTAALDPSYPNSFSRAYPHDVTGSFWLNEDEDGHDVADAVIPEAKRRGADVADDSESGQAFLCGATVEDVKVLIDVLHDQGRIT